jgi:hypothetical protein
VANGGGASGGLYGGYTPIPEHHASSLRLILKQLVYGPC